MKAIITVIVIALCGLLFYSFGSGEEVQAFPEVSTDDKLNPPPEPDTTVYIQYEDYPCDTCKESRLVLDTLRAKIDSSLSLLGRWYKIRVEYHPEIEDKKETIFLFPKGITRERQYTIPDDSNWYCDINVKAVDSLKGIHTFAAIYNYKDSINAEYIYGNSVCKIKIDY